MVVGGAVGVVVDGVVVVVDGVVVVVDVDEPLFIRVPPARTPDRVCVDVPVVDVPDVVPPDCGVPGVGAPSRGVIDGDGDNPGVEGVVGDGVGATPPGAGCSGKVPGAVGNAGEPGVGRLLPLGGVAGATGCVGVADVGGVMVVWAMPAPATRKLEANNAMLKRMAVHLTAG